jgi:hypothetical protein
MTSLRPALAIGASLFVLAAASLLDVARMEPQVASVRGDRQTIASNVNTGDCGKDSLIAACAGTPDKVTPMPPVTSIQVFEKPGETTLVRVKLGD